MLTKQKLIPSAVYRYRDITKNVIIIFINKNLAITSDQQKLRILKIKPDIYKIYQTRLNLHDVADKWKVPVELIKIYIDTCLRKRSVEISDVEIGQVYNMDRKRKIIGLVIDKSEKRVVIITQFSNKLQIINTYSTRTFYAMRQPSISALAQYWNVTEKNIEEITKRFFKPNILARCPPTEISDAQLLLTSLISLTYKHVTPNEIICT